MLSSPLRSSPRRRHPRHLRNVRRLPSGPIPTAPPTSAALNSPTTSTTSPPKKPPPAAPPSPPSPPGPRPKRASARFARKSSPSSAASPKKPRSTPNLSAPHKPTASASKKSSTNPNPTSPSPHSSIFPTPNQREHNPQQKLPAIVIAPGHGFTGKATDYTFASTFARNGFAVLSYDPIGQGERLQYPDPADPSKTLLKAATGEHGEAGLQPTLIGDALARTFAWDGIRAVDYLTSRPEIDPNRIGAFGCSGGGTMTALLGALDTRVHAIAVACYLTSFDTLLPTLGPQDAEQSTPNFIASGLDFPDWVELAAPRPYAIISTAQDMFPYAGALATATEARRFYALFDPASAGTIPTSHPSPEAEDLLLFPQSPPAPPSTPTPPTPSPPPPPCNGSPA